MSIAELWRIADLTKVIAVYHGWQRFRRTSDELQV